MSVLASLVRAYDRLPDAPPYGYSPEKISFCVALKPDGSVTEVIDLRDVEKKHAPRIILVPQAKKRAAGIDPNLFWDKTAYVLGVTAGDGKRTAREHAEFKNFHLQWIRDEDDQGLVALRNFLDNWQPKQFAPPVWSDDVLDKNIVFRLESDSNFLHERPAAKALRDRTGIQDESEPQICLVTGEATPIGRLHPPIKGVWDAQKAGASLVSFNLDAFTSYGHKQGDNAPVSNSAAFAYTTTLNRFLDKDSGHRLQIGDASTVFWADSENPADAQEAENIFTGMFNTTDDEAVATAKVKDRLDEIRNGRRLMRIAPDTDGVRFFVLGLAPNAARLSVRFYWEGDFGELTANYQRYLNDTEIEPAPPDGWPPIWRYLLELAPQNKRENVPPLIAGEWMRAILSGTPYPMTLLSTTLMRVRADREVNVRRVAMLKCVLIRNYNLKEVPMALDHTYTDKGYILGRLFAVYEEVQRAALGRNLNATIKDKFYGSASTTPQKVFHTLGAGSQNHFSKLRKQNIGRAVNLEKLLVEITDLMEPGNDPIPASLNTAEQALFSIGYYHQRSDFFRKNDDKTTEVTE